MANAGVAHAEVVPARALGALNEARAWAEEAVRLCSDTDADRDVYYTALAGALEHCYELFGQRADLAGVLVCFDRAANAVPPNAPVLPVLLGNLAKALLRRHDLGEYEQDLDAAVEMVEEALGLADGSDDLQLPILLVDASDAFARRWWRDGRAQDAARAVELAEQALARVRPTASGHASARLMLGRALAARFEARGDPADRGAALAAWRDVCQQHLTTVPSAALAAATQMASWSNAQGLRQEAADAYAMALAAERRVYRAQALREDKEAWLASSQRLFGDAAFAFAAVGDTLSASTAIEQGRARLLTERLRRDEAEVARLLHEGHDDMHRAFVEAAHRVNALEASPLLEPQRAQAVSDASRAARDAVADLDAAVEAIRLLPGWGSFLESSEPVPVRSGGGPAAPLVYVMPGDEGGLVLVVGPDGTTALGPDDLPALTVQAVGEQVLGLLRSAEEDVRGWPRRLDETLGWLWACAVGSTLDLLRDHREADFVACGLLGLLPLHAAWTQDGEGRRYAGDGLVWRYLPSGALRRPDRLPDQRTTGTLVVHSPELPGAPDLPGATTEARVLLRRPGTVLLTGRDATAENVADALRHADLVHLACHAHADLGRPLDSAFLLADDGFLSVRDLFRLPQRPRSLAVLSACETGLPGGRVPDEVVSLSSALMITGTSGIVATCGRCRTQPPSC